jgi:hypothetical protein
MSHNKPASYHSNRYNAQSACELCEGVIRHEHWCLTVNPAVHYAYEIAVYPDKLTIGDAIILRSLGVLWCDRTAELGAPSRTGTLSVELPTTVGHSVQRLTSSASDQWVSSPNGPTETT